MRFEGVDDRNGAEALRGQARQRPTPLDDAPEGELWVHELIGSEVRDRAGAVSGGSSRSRRIPRTTCSCSTAARWSRWCSSSRTSDGVVVVDLPEGLLDL